MPAYKEKDKDTWYVQFYYKDWTGQNRKKLKRSFRCKKDAIEWERNFILQQTCNLDMMLFVTLSAPHFRKILQIKRRYRIK